MKTLTFPRSLAILAIASLATLGFSAGAQETSTTPAVQVTGSAPTPQLSYGVSQILQLNQAKVGDDTIIAYVRNAGNSYGLDANQIIFIRQQGVSEAVITAMLNQPKAGVAPANAPAPSGPPPSALASNGGSTAAYYDPNAAGQPTATVAPSVTYVQSVPTYYYPSSYYYPYSYPYSYPYYGYGYWPGISIGFGWYGGYGYRGGYYGGGYRYGGGWRGGGSWGGGGWHGGGGGGWHGGGGIGGGWHGGGGGHR